MLKPGALFFLGVPVNAEHDVLSFNAHRIYGPARLPLLTAGFDILDVFGHISTEPPHASSYTQPVLVLQKPAQISDPNQPKLRWGESMGQQSPAYHSSQTRTT
jgi:hypothetical protein